MNELKKQLLDAYAEENLNTISAKILELYKQKQQNALKQICKFVNDCFPFPFEANARLYSKLLMLYHPDKQKDYLQKIDIAEDVSALERYSHIIPTLKFVSGDIHLDSGFKTPEEFEREYGWNYQAVEDDYFILREEVENTNELFDEENPSENYYFPEGEPLPEGSFLASLKRKIYGASHIEFPTHLLEDLEEIEMAEYEIDQLDGIEFCTHVKVLDLSYNQIFDITQLEHCSYIQELYLSNNQVHYIDAIFHMADLRVLDLSNNSVADITALFHLKCLEFVNLMGNPVSKSQVDRLKKSGVVVVV